VSVDPDRDSNEKLEEYLKLFGEDFIGVTGKDNNDPMLKNMMKVFRIYASKIQLDEGNIKNAYTIDHTVLTYLMDDENKFVDFFGNNLSPEELKTQIVDKVLKHK